MTESTQVVTTKEDLKRQKAELGIELQRVELETKKAELLKAVAEAERSEAQAYHTKLNAEAAQREEENRKKTLPNRLNYDFNDEVDGVSVAMFSNWLHGTSLRNPNTDLTVYINSPGGSVYDGFVAMDAIREVEERGNPVTVKITGMAASMGGIIAQAASTRLIGKRSWLMIHPVATFSFGYVKTFEATDKAEYSKKLTTQCLEAYAERTDKWTAAALFEKLTTDRKDWWLTAEEALAEGFVDAIF